MVTKDAEDSKANVRTRNISEEGRRRIGEAAKKKWEAYRAAKASGDGAPTLKEKPPQTAQASTQASGKKRLAKEEVVRLFLQQFPTMEVLRENMLNLTVAELQRQTKAGNVRWYCPATTKFKSGDKFNWFGDILPNLLVASGLFNNLTEAKAFTSEVQEATRQDTRRRISASKSASFRRQTASTLGITTEEEPATAEIEVLQSGTGLDLQRRVEERIAMSRPAGLLGRVQTDLARKNKKGWTPLHLATIDGNPGLIETYLRAGASLETEGTGNWRPLHLAIKHNHFELAEIFIEIGANVNAATSYNLTPLHLAAEKGHAVLAELLLKRGARTFVQDEYGRTALHFAARADNPHIIGLLLSHDAANIRDEMQQALVHISDATGWQPLHLAAQRGNLEIVRLLLDYGANVNAKNANGWTPLHMAVLSGNAELVDFLLGTGAEVDAKAKTPNMSYGRITPLHLAAESRHPQAKAIIQLLLDRFADVNAKDENGKKPVELASADLRPLFYSHSTDRLKAFPMQQPPKNGRTGHMTGQATHVHKH